MHTCARKTLEYTYCLPEALVAFLGGPTHGYPMVMRSKKGDSTPRKGGKKNTPRGKSPGRAKTPAPPEFAALPTPEPIDLDEIQERCAIQQSVTSFPIRERDVRLI